MAAVMCAVDLLVRCVRARLHLRDMRTGDAQPGQSRSYSISLPYAEVAMAITHHELPIVEVRDQNVTAAWQKPFRSGGRVG